METMCDEIPKKRKCISTVLPQKHKKVALLEAEPPSEVQHIASGGNPNCMQPSGVTSQEGTAIENSEDVDLLSLIELNPDHMELVNVTAKEKVEAESTLSDLQYAMELNRVYSQQSAAAANGDGVLQDARRNSLVSEGTILSVGAASLGKGQQPSHHLVSSPNPRKMVSVLDLNSEPFGGGNWVVGDLGPKTSGSQTVIGGRSSEPTVTHQFSSSLAGASHKFRVNHVNASSKLLRNPEGKLTNPNFRCSECAMEFNSNRDMTVHMRIVHLNGNALPAKVESEGKDDTISFYCSECCLEFPSERDRRLHTNRAHLTFRRYTCSECGCHFQFSHDLRLHRDSAHGQTRGALHCTCDRKPSPQCDQLGQQPEVIAEPECASTFACNHCSQMFDQVEQLKSHLQAQHYRSEEYFSCAKCSMKFTDTSRLRDHVRTAHTIRKTYQCPCCDRTFTNSWGLKVHLRAKKSHVCPKCNKKFASALNVDSSSVSLVLDN